MKNKVFFVFDVETIGLHGEAFAYGFTVVDLEGKELDSGFESFPSQCAQGDSEDRIWVAQNVLPHLPKKPTIPAAIKGFGVRRFGPHRVLCQRFWNKWMEWKEQEATLWAECSWPMEANFLSKCVQIDSSRKWEAPYPLHDIATARLCAGLDSLANEERLESEKPKHNPLADARQSARLLLESLDETPRFWLGYGHSEAERKKHSASPEG